MFESAEAIINQYIDVRSRYFVSSVEMERGENPEDLYYLCHIDDAWYVVYETDYISALDRVPEEAVALFADSVIRPLGWLVKKDQQLTLNAMVLPLDVLANGESLILERDGSYLRYAVLAVEVAKRTGVRYDPSAYGSIRRV
ncbi:hypothetical protein [Streptomyces sp. NPDC048669]|uniref:hypothetical protein n=1 Tax=Streptomyces sp. NPDC048669 TaxID=3155267 RepID=UPI00341C3B88